MSIECTNINYLINGRLIGNLFLLIHLYASIAISRHYYRHLT